MIAPTRSYHALLRGVAGEEDKEEEMGKAYTDAGDAEGDADMGGDEIRMLKMLTGM